MGGGGGGGGFRGTKGSSIRISDKKIYQDGKHFNKHGRDMGYKSIKAYDSAAKEFAEKHQNHPDAKVYEGKWNGTGSQHREIQRIITYEGKTVIVNKDSGQVIDFYRGEAYRGIIELERIR